MRKIVLIACVLMAVWNMGQAGYIWVKADLAQWLISDAWQQTLAKQAWQKPWSWADTWPVFRLEFPEQDEQLFVLSGSSGNALAFGPGHDSSSELPGQGNSVVGGHRDTHFELLEHIRLGEAIRVQTREGEWRDYAVTSIEIMDSRHESLEAEVSVDMLTLVTCFPFDAVNPGGPMRFVVKAHGQLATNSEEIEWLEGAAASAMLVATNITSGI